MLLQRFSPFPLLQEPRWTYNRRRGSLVVFVLKSFGVSSLEPPGERTEAFSVEVLCARGRLWCSHALGWGAVFLYCIRGNAAPPDPPSRGAGGAGACPSSRSGERRGSLLDPYHSRRDRKLVPADSSPAGRPVTVSAPSRADRDGDGGARRRAAQSRKALVKGRAGGDPRSRWSRPRSPGADRRPPTTRPTAGCWSRAKPAARPPPGAQPDHGPATWCSSTGSSRGSRGADGGEPPAHQPGRDAAQGVAAAAGG